jgi:hypothetical protein
MRHSLLWCSFACGLVEYLASSPATERETFQEHMKGLVSELRQSNLYDIDCKKGYESRWKRVLQDVRLLPVPSLYPALNSLSC